MKRILFVLLLSSFITQLFSQGLGLRIGGNSATQSVNYSDEIYLSFTRTVSNLYGFQFGIDYEKNISNSLYFNPAILFSQKGSTSLIEFNKGVILPESFDQTDVYNYIVIPLDFIYKTGSEKTKLGIFAGPYLGYLIKQTSEAKGEKQEITENNNNLDYGIDVGALLEFDKINLRFAYEFGLADALDVEKIQIKNRVISLTLGYQFR